METHEPNRLVDLLTTDWLHRSVARMIFQSGGLHCVKQTVLTRSGRFRLLNIVGCLLKKRLTKGAGGGGVTGTPGPLLPSYVLVTNLTSRSKPISNGNLLSWRKTEKN